MLVSKVGWFTNKQFLHIAVQEMLQRFMLFYNETDSRPVFGTVDEMLKWTGLYGLTQRTLEEELSDAGLNSRTISELVTVWFCSYILSSLISVG